MSDGPLSPEEVAHRGFGTSFRGFDTNEVRSYLVRVADELRSSIARERELNRRLADAEHRAANPVLDRDTLTRALGEEMARILATAQEAASELRTKAEENAARILREAHEQAKQIRGKAEGLLAERTVEAEAEAGEIRRAAAGEAAQVVERARQEAAGVLADVEARGRLLVQEAHAARARVLGDLTRRRKALHGQVEQLRAGRERLLDAYRLVRRTTDEVADELQRVEVEAREAAAAAAAGADDRAGAADAEPVEELDDVLAAFPQGMAERAEGADAAQGDAAPGAASPDTAGGEAAGGEVASSVPAGETTTAGERAPRPAPLRLLRRPEEPGSGSPETAQPRPESEGVRIIATRPGAAAPTSPVEAPSPVPGATGDAPEDAEGPPAHGGQTGSGDPPAAEDTAVSEAGAGDPPGGQAPPPVDELFARIRAGRAEAVAKARQVLAGPEGAEAGAAGPDGPETGDSGAAAATTTHGIGAEAAESLLQRRDGAVEQLETRLARKLKRALQDEQNEVLDRLRSSGSTNPDAVLPSAADQAARYRRAAEELLGSAAAAGLAFVSPAGGPPPDVADLAGELTAALADPLRRSLERALGGDAVGDATVAVERVGAAYRECKGQRIEGLAGDAVTAAFSRGALAGLVPGTPAQWIVDDDGRPCPDCDDNALAGPTPAGDAFPTGQTHPPAHTGCRCLLAPAEVPAAANGTG